MEKQHTSAVETHHSSHGCYNSYPLPLHPHREFEMIRIFLGGGHAGYPLVNLASLLTTSVRRIPVPAPLICLTPELDERHCELGLTGEHEWTHRITLLFVVCCFYPVSQQELFYRQIPDLNACRLHTYKRCIRSRRGNGNKQRQKSLHNYTKPSSVNFGPRSSTMTAIEFNIRILLYIYMCVYPEDEKNT